MSRAVPVLLLLLGCAEQEFSVTNLPPPAGDLRISGRICDPVTRTWLADALVYTHLYNDRDVVYDSRSTYTDPDGRYELVDLVADKDYEIYVQVGHDIVETFILGLGTEDLVVPAGPCDGTVDLEVAVITGAYDDLGPMLTSLGLGDARRIDGQTGTEIVDFLTDPAAMSDYDLIFVDGGIREDGVVHGSGPISAVLDGLRDYVRAGGVVFATDWAYDLVERAWPDPLDFVGDDTVPDAAQIGEAAVVDARIADPELASLLQTDRLDIRYDLPVWPVIEAASPEVRVYLEGEAPWRNGLEAGILSDAPLLVGFDEGEGQVLFSTYRSSANGDQQALGLMIALLDGVID